MSGLLLKQQLCLYLPTGGCTPMSCPYGVHILLGNFPATFWPTCLSFTAISTSKPNQDCFFFFLPDSQFVYIFVPICWEVSFHFSHCLFLATEFACRLGQFCPASPACSSPTSTCSGNFLCLQDQPATLNNVDLEPFVPRFGTEGSRL